MLVGIKDVFRVLFRQILDSIFPFQIKMGKGNLFFCIYLFDSLNFFSQTFPFCAEVKVAYNYAFSHLIESSKNKNTTQRPLARTTSYYAK